MAKCTKLWERLNELYNELGEKLEDELANPEDHLTDNGMQELSQRIDEATSCKVIQFEGIE